jgi:hypothetical protein
VPRDPPSLLTPTGRVKRSERGPFERRKHERRKPMTPPEDIKLPSSNKLTTVADELQFLCKKFADVDAIWRITESSQSPGEPENWLEAA